MNLTSIYFQILELKEYHGMYVHDLLASKSAHSNNDSLLSKFALAAFTQTNAFCLFRYYIRQ
jgi:hypothetical protein